MHGGRRRRLQRSARPAALSNSELMQGQFFAGAVKRLLGCAPFSVEVVPFHGSPFQSSACSGGFLSRPSHHTVLSSRLCTTLVKMVSFCGWMCSAFGLDFSFVPGATPKKPFSGLMAHRRPSGPMRIQAMSSPTRPDLVALLCGSPPAGSAWPGWSCRRRTGMQRRYISLRPAGSRCRGSAYAQPSSPRSCPGRKRCAVQSTSCPAARFRRNRSCTDDDGVVLREVADIALLFIDVALGSAGRAPSRCCRRERPKPSRPRGS